MNWYSSGVIAHYLGDLPLLWWVLFVPFAIAILCGLGNLAGRGRSGWSFWVFVAGVLGLHAFGVIDLLTLVTHRYIELAAGFVVYLVFALPWARFYKWRRFLNFTYDHNEAARLRLIKSTLDGARRDWHNELYKLWFEERAKTVDQFPNENSERNRAAAAETKRAWAEHWTTEKFDAKWKDEVVKSAPVQLKLKSALDEAGYEKPISADDHLHLIASWAMWWPFLFVYAVVFRMIFRLGRWIYDRFYDLSKLAVKWFQAASDKKFEEVKAKRKEGDVFGSQS